MTSTPIALAGQHLRRLTAPQSTERLSDRELLRRFVRVHDGEAFAVLMCRHGPAVLRVCRRLLPQEADAEDVFQATFVLLTRKAAALRKPDALGSWLYGVAYRLALKVRKAAARRRTHESRVRAKAAADPLAELTARETRAALDETLRCLPESYRAPLVLCPLEGLSQEEAARQLHCSRSTLKRRLERGRELLRTRLVRRGVMPPRQLVFPPSEVMTL